ncbi:hypothetical protein B0H13DRAFT_2237919 [Mycena leptocephala]|nr:hypothetical protein B0H13DRAFT_2237919 [Mycena leptocephala]
MTSLSSSLNSGLTSDESHVAHLSDSDVRPKVVVSRHLGPAIPLLQDRKNIEIVLWPEERPCGRAWVLQNIKGVTGVLANEELLDAAGPSLRVVSTMSVGYEHIDLPLMANGTSESVTFCGPQLSTTASSPTRTVGILGFGRIAQATLAGLVAFGITHCTIRTALPYRPETTTVRDAALQAIHKLKALEHRRPLCAWPGGNETHHLVDAIFLRKMKPTSVLVDTGRGSVIWGAGLDVVEDEPAISKDHPLVKEPRCVMVPRIGSATLQTRLDMATCAIDNLVGGLFGGEMQ